MRLLWFGVLILLGAAEPAAAADCIDPWRSNGPLYQLIAPRLPSTVFNRNGPTSGAFGQSVFGSYGSVDFSAVLDSPCSRKVDLSVLTPDDYSSAVNSGLLLNLLLGFAVERDAKRLVDTDGFDKQIVEPRAAKSSFAGLPGAGDWNNRVAEENPEVDQGKSACQLAIDELKAVACRDEPDKRCDIETSYRRGCLDTRDKAIQGSCVVAVDNYLNLCFGRGVPPPGAESAVPLCRVTSDGRRNYEDYCSSSMAAVSINSYDRVFLLTAKHCLPSNVQTEKPPVSFDLVGGCSVNGLDNGLSHYGSDSADLALVEASRHSALFDGPRRVETPSIGRPVLFKRTYLGGFSSLAESRNEAAENYNRNNNPPPKNLPTSFPLRSTLRWDTSALCTIVKIDGDQLTHTCQSASGTSGGAIVQLDGSDNNGAPRLVGIHLGAPEKTSGAYNYGLALDPDTEIRPRQ